MSGQRLGKPPKHSQYKPGQSGNPSGGKRKEPIDNLRVIVENVFAEPVRTSDGKTSRTISKLELLFLNQRNNALTGNAKDAVRLFRRAQKVGLFNQAKPESFMVIDPAGNAEQQMILQAFHASRAAESTDN